MSTKAKSKTVAKKTTPKQAHFAASAKVVALKERKQGGAKKKFHALIPKKGGITLTALKAKAAKELKVPATKVEPWLRGFVRRGLVKVA